MVNVPWIYHRHILIQCIHLITCCNKNWSLFGGIYFSVCVVLILYFDSWDIHVIDEFTLGINIYCHVRDWHFPPNFDFACRFYISLGMPSLCQIDWCCFHYFVRKCLVALLEDLCARILFFRFVNIGFVLTFSFLLFMCEQDLCLWESTCLLPLSTRLLCLVVAIPLVCWVYMCAFVCVPLCVHV